VHRPFVVETFIKTGYSLTLTQRRFRVRYNVSRHGKISSRNAIFCGSQTSDRLAQH
jgi:hypothetical protein